MCQGGRGKDGSQLCHSCANYSKMNGIRPSTGGGAGAGATVRSPPAKIKVSSSGVRATIIIIINIIIIIIMLIFAEREPQDGDDLRQLPDQHHHALEEERPGGAGL